MSLIDDYRRAMDMVAEVERGPVDKFSEETRSFAALVRSVDDYHRETQKRSDWLEGELTDCKGKLASAPIRIRLIDKQGWTVDYRQIERIKTLASNMEDVSLEKVEAVVLAMIDAGMAWTSEDTFKVSMKIRDHE